MAARRCSICGINYPNHLTYRSTYCPIHQDEDLVFMSDINEDEDWEQRAQEIAEAFILAEEDQTLIPDLDQDALFVQDGRTFVFSWDVIERGIGHRLPDGTLLRVGENVYEVIGYVDAMRAYWVGPFRMFLTDRDIRDLGNPKARRRKRHK